MRIVNSFTNWCKKKWGKQNTDNLNNFQSRIQDVYIELPKYQYYHSPYNPENEDTRFIGRKKLTEKLKRIIDNTKTASGAYLITGIRGMGKSSFIRSVFSDYSRTKSDKEGLSLAAKYPIILLILFLILAVRACFQSFDNTLETLSLGKLISFSMTAYTFFILLFTLFSVERFTKSFRNNNILPLGRNFSLLGNVNIFFIGIYLLAIIFPNIPFMSSIFYTQTRFNLGSYALFAVSFPFLIFIIYPYSKYNLYKPVKDIHVVFFLLSMYFLTLSSALSMLHFKVIDIVDLVLVQIYPVLFISILLLILRFGYYYNRLHDKKYESEDIVSFWKVLWQEIFDIKKKNTDMVDISVGYDTISERDIFVLITKGLKEKIKEYTISKHYNMHWLFYILIFLITYSLPIVVNFRHEFYNKYELVGIFPSQMNSRENKSIRTSYSNFYIQNKQELQKRLNIYYSNYEEEQKLNKNNYPDSLSMIIDVKSSLINSKKPLKIDISKTDSGNQEKVEIQPSDKQAQNYKVSLSSQGDKSKSVLSNSYHYPIIKWLGLESCKMIASIDIYTSSVLQYYLNRLTIPLQYINLIDNYYYIIFRYSLFMHILLVFFVIWLVRIIIKIKLKYFDKIYKSIQELETRLYASFSSSRGTDVPSYSGITSLLRLRQTKVDHPLPSAKEIEQELIKIFHLIKVKHDKGKLPLFLILIDEIDKIEAFSNQTLAEIEEETTEQLSSKSQLTTIAEQTRKRRNSIFNLLSNLKHFFTTTETKFFFIAGKEIYDASLADVSDRDFFLRSIFHDVLNIESFYKDLSDGNPQSISTMTESYICQFLIPRDYINNRRKIEGLSSKYKLYCVREYRGYLQENMNLHGKELDKVISVLQHFVVYLAYRSNGAPKRISALFEEFIEPFPVEKLSYIKKNELLVGRSANNLYLRFGYYNQYVIEFTNYLVGPLLLPSNASVQDFGDKLLVDTSFIYDHILKFHKTGFSWQDLEFMPEFLDINKAPELRDMMQRVLTSLQQSHMESIQNGIYNFVFNKRIVEEIRFLSKVSEKDAAAFNFTLDESFVMKRHHYQKLKILSNQRYLNTHTEMQIDNSEMFTHLLLGDLHFNDEEYEEALIQYRKAIQPIRFQTIPQHEITLFITFLKCMLKIGLTYEKMHNYDNALAYYEKACVDVVKFRNIDLKDLELIEVQIKKLKDDPNNTRLKRLVKRSDFLFDDIKTRLIHRVEHIKKGETHRLIIKPSQLDVCFIESIEDHEIELPLLSSYKNSKVIERSNNFWHLLIRTEFSPQKEELLSKIAVFENVRILIQPFIAKLHVLEKAYHGGLVLSDMNRVEKEFDFINKILRKREEQFIQSEFWKKIGDLIFFKNPDFIQSSLDVNGTIMLRDFKKTILYQNLRYFTPFRHKLNKMFLECTNPNAYPKCTVYTEPCLLSIQSCYACYIYMHNIDHLHRTYFEPDDLLGRTQSGSAKYKFLDTINKILNNMEQKRYERLTPVQWVDLAKNISALSDCYMSCCVKNLENDTLLSGIINRIWVSFTRLKDLQEAQHNQNNEVDKLNHPFHSIVLNEIFSQDNHNTPIIKAFIGYLTALLVFRRTGYYRYEADSIRKIVYLLYTFHGYDPSKQGIRLFFDALINLGIQECYHTYDSIHRSEINRKREFLLNQPIGSRKMVQINSISIYPEINELIAIFEGYKLKRYFVIMNRLKPYKMHYSYKMEMQCLFKHAIQEFQDFVNQIGPYAFANMMSIRALNLNFKSKFYSLIYQILCEKYNYDHDYKEEFEAQEKRRLEQVVDADDLEYLRSIDIIPINTLPGNNDNPVQLKDVLFTLIKEGLYCMEAIIKYLHIAGISYTTNHSCQASAYFHMGRWCKHIDEFIVLIDEDQKSKYLDPVKEKITIITHGYYYAKAKEHYKLALDVQQGGEAYQRIIRNMYFLNEDFNSDLFHFSHALERSILRQKETYNRFKSLRNLDQKSELYKKDNYLKERTSESNSMN